MAINASQAQQALSRLRDPTFSLLQYGQVHDQKTSKFIRYDPHRLTNSLQQTMLHYAAHPPRNEHGQTCWLVCLGYRQGGKSTTAEYVGYPLAAYSPGWDHVCIADNKPRAEYLHSRIHHLHERWPVALRTPTAASREARQLTFNRSMGGKMRILSGEAGAVGIGQSPDFFHGSELPFWNYAAEQFTLLWPSMIQRDNCLVINESTPAPSSAPSVEWWKDHCRDAKLRKGRLIYAFFPFWDGKLNRRPWRINDIPDSEEISLMNQYGSQGLTLDHLAFRRLMMDTDPEISKNPDLFKVFYPFDDETCWGVAASCAFPVSTLEKHKRYLKEWTPPYTEFESPQSGAIYVIGADPAGHVSRDHAAFQVLKVWEGEWTQVATFAAHIDPNTFTDALVETAEKYNKAHIVVESNGVGEATIALLLAKGYPNLYYAKAYRPGFVTTRKSLEDCLAWTTTALDGPLIINDKDTYSQLCSYRRNKLLEDSVVAEIVRGKVGKARKERHHWDKVSALFMAVVGARRMPQRSKPTDDADNVISMYSDMSYNQTVKYHKDVKEATTERNNKRRFKYTSVRRRK